MKKIIIVTTVLLIGYGSAKAQFQAGGGLFLVTDGVFDLGLDLRGTYQFNENWRGALTLSFFLPDKEEINFTGLVVSSSTEITSRAFGISTEANYLFTDLSIDNLTLYGIAGLNFISVSVETSSDVTGFEASGSDSGVSFTFGAGADFEIDKSFIPFGELKYSAGEANYAAIVAGVRFPIN